jgi:penicillin-binding protein 1B
MSFQRIRELVARLQPRVVRVAAGLAAWARGSVALAVALVRLSAWYARPHWKPLAVAGACSLALIASLDCGVDSRFTSELFPVATRAYSRPLHLTRGVDVQRAELLGHLERTGYREVDAAPVERGEFAVRGREIVIGRRAFAFIDSLEHGGQLVVTLDRQGRVARLQDEQGRIGEAWIEPELIGSFYGTHWVDRRRLPLDAYPQRLIDALIALEDRRFFEHAGLDLRRIVGAAIANLRAGRVVQGGSTLTQQLVKNLYLSADRSLLRKLQEAPMAVYLEWHHDKREILEAYLNEIYLGQRGPVAIHGMGAAAQHYFGKDVRELTLAESAFLVGLIHGPGLYSPQHDPAAARARRDVVLGILLDLGRMSEAEHARAVAEDLVARKLGAYTNTAPYFLSSLRRSLAADYDAQELETDGYVVMTTLDPSFQRRAQRAIDQTLGELEQRYPRLRREGAPLQAALVAFHPPSGELLAMIGGRDYAISQFNRAEQARRQPGSAFKPVAALAALSARDADGPAYTLASLLEDVPLRLETPAGEWSPANYDGRFSGRVSLREALEQSLNVPFVRLGLALGPDQLARTAQRLGIQSPLERVPSLVLGSSEVSLLELTAAYAVLAAEGIQHPSTTIRALFDDQGALRESPERASRELYTPAEAYLVTSALMGAVDRGTGRGLRAAGYRGPVAGKTGTTNDERDAWFVGYTPELAIGVWVGFDDNSRVGLTGAQAALPIFQRVLMDSLGREGGASFQRPRGIEHVSINRERGVRAAWGCRGERELFLAGTAPTEYCGERGLGGWFRSRF